MVEKGLCSDLRKLNFLNSRTLTAAALLWLFVMNQSERLYCCALSLLVWWYGLVTTGY